MIIHPNTPESLKVASRVRSIALADPEARLVITHDTDGYLVRFWVPGDACLCFVARDWLALHDMWMTRGEE